ncbi:PhzF family phenazine biosynthesis protein [Roseospira visakhapatnamensis]|uniref:PhzF family phenazine biosynthesis protein n=1 Tax=Roseospira visakhapatnamensis TaxID=390880 RepID=A0A7W6W9M0_9PROT|nr:PhzF family phenazine biosynthesis protein [Roseospira visakhapatnamensis]MBB4266014.1 PhzF family phenazine biosynthesis protein [Roseospira visakhapatnamensis]
MPSLPLFQVDAFADRPFTGNPAAVVPLTTWPDDALLQAIAAENNLSETAFLVPETDPSADTDDHLRWFTPTVEVDLCGHATLAAAWVVMTQMRPDTRRARFRTRSGTLTVTRAEARADAALSLDVPARPPQAATAPPDGLAEALGAPPIEVLEAPEALLAVVADADTVRGLTPDMRALARFLGARFAIVTAPADHPGADDPGIDDPGADDFVSRVFAPGHDIDEDPVTGAAHCTLAPYWAARLGRREVTGFQASARGGRVRCRLAGDRVILSGTVVPILSGQFTLPDAPPGVRTP